MKPAIDSSNPPSIGESMRYSITHRPGGPA